MLRCCGEAWSIRYFGRVGGKYDIGVNIDDTSHSDRENIGEK